MHARRLFGDLVIEDELPAEFVSRAVVVPSRLRDFQARPRTRRPGAVGRPQISTTPVSCTWSARRATWRAPTARSRPASCRPSRCWSSANSRSPIRHARPPGGHTLWIETHVPPRPRDGSWAEVRDGSPTACSTASRRSRLGCASASSARRHTRRPTSRRATRISSTAISPAAAMSLHQQLVFRPVRGWFRYNTPDQGFVPVLGVGTSGWRRARHGRAQLRPPRATSSIGEREVTMKLGLRVNVGCLRSLALQRGCRACGGGGDSSRTIEVDYQTDDAAGVVPRLLPAQRDGEAGHDAEVPPDLDRRAALGDVRHDGRQGSQAVAPAADVITPPASIPPFPTSRRPNTTPSLGRKSAEPVLARVTNSAKTRRIRVTWITRPICRSTTRHARRRNRSSRAFTGRQAYYSSGFIPFEGDLANKFEMKIADDAKEGTYFYYCNVHGVLMGGDITVKKDAKVESQGSAQPRGVSEEAQDRIAHLRRRTRKRMAGKSEFKGNLAGSGDETTEQVEGAHQRVHAAHDRAKVGQKGHVDLHRRPHDQLQRAAVHANLQVRQERQVRLQRGLDKASRRVARSAGAPSPTSTQPSGRLRRPGHQSTPARGTAPADCKSTGTGWNTGDKYTVTFTKKGTYPVRLPDSSRA